MTNFDRPGFHYVLIQLLIFQQFKPKFQILEFGLKGFFFILDEDESKKTKIANRPSRNKKISEVSEEDEANDDVNKPKRETRSKKISERSDDLEESPAPPLRSTRRSRKNEESTSAERDEAVDKRLSRVKGKKKLQHYC